jgi:hypothetical protein
MENKNQRSPAGWLIPARWRWREERPTLGNRGGSEKRLSGKREDGVEQGGAIFPHGGDCTTVLFQEAHVKIRPDTTRSIGHPGSAATDQQQLSGAFPLRLPRSPSSEDHVGLRRVERVSRHRASLVFSYGSRTRFLLIFFRICLGMGYNLHLD